MCFAFLAGCEEAEAVHGSEGEAYCLPKSNMLLFSEEG